MFASCAVTTKYLSTLRSIPFLLSLPPDHLPKKNMSKINAGLALSTQFLNADYKNRRPSGRNARKNAFALWK
jgi:hypothetical protein